MPEGGFSHHRGSGHPGSKLCSELHAELNLSQRTMVGGVGLWLASAAVLSLTTQPYDRGHHHQRALPGGSAASPPDSTAFLQHEIDGAPVNGVVVLPAGVLYISYPLNLTRGHVTVSGAPGRQTTLIQTNASAALFVAMGRVDPRTNDTEYVSSVTVKDLVLVGGDSGIAHDMGTTTSAVAAVDVVAVSNLSVRGCDAQGVGLVRVGTPFHINVWDKTPDPAASAGLVREDQLSKDITVTDNNADGGSGGSSAVGIELHFVRNVFVSNNTLRRHAHGIMWWGGDANPSRGGKPTNPRWARNITIKNNIVASVGGGGVWGSMGQGISVQSNNVSTCGDVCLDAEGSFNVTFVDNTAVNSANGVLSVFFNCQVRKRCAS